MTPTGASRRNSRTQERRACSLYLRLVNHRTGETVGDVADLSFNGFKLESSKAIAPDCVFAFRMDLPGDLSEKPFMVFHARSRWCRTDPLDGRLYDIGFEIIAIDPADARIFERVFERYGARSTGGNWNSGDWRRK
jgi:hypothetical protein